MLNIEYYKDKLVELGVMNFDKLAIIQGQPHICDNIEYTKCLKCLFIKDPVCSEEALNWLLTEYKEPEVDWSKVKVDTPILVRSYESNKWIKRYFAKFEGGQIYAWCDGATSWTANDECDVTSWNCAKLAERSEKNED